MARAFLATLLLPVFVGSVETSNPWQPSSQLVFSTEPDPTRSQPLDHWPNAADLERLQSVEGKSRVVILQVLGHPSRVGRRFNGEEIWEYPWCASCRVCIRQGVCTGTFYTAGY